MKRSTLPVGHGFDRMRLWDRQYRLLWDSAVAITPAYQHISTWVNATIDQPDGTRRLVQLYRCPEGIKSWTPDDLRTLLTWPNPSVSIDGDEVWP